MAQARVDHSLALGAAIKGCIGRYLVKSEMQDVNDKSRALRQLITELANIHLLPTLKSLTSESVTKFGEKTLWARLVILDEIHNSLLSVHDKRAAEPLINAAIETYRARALRITARAATRRDAKSPIDNWVRQKKIDNRQAARRLGISLTALYAIKRGTAVKERRCGAETLSRVAEIVGCNIAELEN